MSLVQQDHPDREQLAAFSWGQLEGAEQTYVANHIATCDACCQILREIPDDGFLGRLKNVKPVSLKPPSGRQRAMNQPLPAELRDHPRYQVGKFLGAGGMGIVYKAEHRLMGRQVALKIIHRDLISTPGVIERFRLEVKAAARLHHPNIVTAYDAEQAGDVHFLVMEYVDGVNLAKLVSKQGPFAITHACNCARQTAKGLQHAFESGMVHRDIKPHNLMLTRKAQIKILDFGLARLANESVSEFAFLDDEPDDRPGLTVVGTAVGTPDYMAPEQAIDSRQADIRADIYSLGCTLYFLLVGQSPFPRRSALSRWSSPRDRRPRPITELRSNLPPSLVAIVEKMMASDPLQRYQAPAEVAKVLTPFTRPGAVAAPEPNPPAKPAVAAESPARTEAAETVETSLDSDMFFHAKCPFCPTRIRIPKEAIGVSIPCPKCKSYFTAVPEEEKNRTPWHYPSGHRSK